MLATRAPVTEAVSVLHVHSGNLFGGVERILETLSLAAASRSVRSSFAICFQGRLSTTLESMGTTVHDLGETRTTRPDQVRRARRRLLDTLRTGQYDVVLVHSAWSQAIFGPVAHAAGIPLVRWFHAPDDGPWWLDAWAGRVRPALAICNSRYTSDRARPRLPEVRSEIHYPPACPLPAAVAPRAQLRAALGVTEPATVIAIVARLERLKGHQLLIQALARLSSPAWHAWVIGGPQRPEEAHYLRVLERDAVSAGIAVRVRFLGERTDVSDLLHAADIYCQPNVGPEAFGLSFVEALGAGLPVVTSRLGAAPEIVDHRCGILFEPGSVDGLVSALDRLLTDPAERRQLARNAPARAARFCDLRAASERLAQSLSTLTPGHVTS